MAEIIKRNLLFSITLSIYDSRQSSDNWSHSSLSSDTIVYATVGLFGFFINVGIFCILLPQRSINAHATEFLMINQVIKL